MHRHRQHVQRKHTSPAHASSLAAVRPVRYPADRNHARYGYPVAKTPVSRLVRPSSKHDTDGMAVIPSTEPMTANRIAAGSLAILGAASAIPIPLAQLDFAGVINAFNIDSGDSPRALLIIAGVGGFLTILILALAFAGAILALTGAPQARHVLIAAALAGLVTAMPLWIPAGVLIAAAAVMLG